MDIEQFHAACGFPAMPSTADRSDALHREAQAFRELADDLPYPVALQLVTDEEVGGRDGTLHQLEHDVSGELVIIGEYSGLRIATDSKGMVTIT